MYLTLWICIHLLTNSYTPTYLMSSPNSLQNKLCEETQCLHNCFRKTRTTQRQNCRSPMRRSFPHSSTYTPQTYFFPKCTQSITYADEIKINEPHSLVYSRSTSAHIHIWTKSNSLIDSDKTTSPLILQNITLAKSSKTVPITNVRPRNNIREQY